LILKFKEVHGSKGTSIAIVHQRKVNYLLFISLEEFNLT